jgi:hypothetical protein
VVLSDVRCVLVLVLNGLRPDGDGEKKQKLGLLRIF